MIKFQDISSIFLKSSSEAGKLSTIRRLWKRQAGKQRQQLLALESEYRYFKNTIAHSNNTIKGKGRLTELLDQLVNEVGKILGTEHVFLSLLEGQPQVFWVVAYKGNCDLREIPLSQKFMGDSYLAGQTVYLTQENMVAHLPGLAPDLFQSKEQSLLGIPIMIDGNLAGVFEVLLEGHEVVSEHQRKLVEIYADQAAIAVKMTRLTDALARKSEEIELLHEVGRAVANQPSPSILLERVGRTLSEFLQVDACAAFVVQRHSAPPVFRAVHVQNLLSTDIDRLESLVTNEAMSELWQDTKQVVITLPMEEDKTVQVMPLFFRQILQGIIVFCWDYARQTDADYQAEATFKTIANQTAMGLDREHLYGSIKKIGLTDTLTEIANRRFFDFILKKEINRVRRYGRPLSLIMIDIDFFKKINDTWGHQIGDMILKEIGSLLKQQFRSTDLPARYGGEEFAVILPETDAEQAYTLAERLRLQTENQVFDINADRIPVTISVGVSTIEFGEHLDKITEADLVLAADQSLYRAKALGRNRVEASHWKNGELKI
ncbi:MAG: pleD 1 [Firmicutes bacterium]|nr:pleD 1 [Bacillota bacterium]